VCKLKQFIVAEVKFVVSGDFLHQVLTRFAAKELVSFCHQRDQAPKAPTKRTINGA
jgi:hypothetical protein